MKSCKDCSITKSIESFDKHPNMLDGHINVCKSCRHDYCKQWRKENRDSLKIKKALYHKEVKDEVNAKVRDDRRSNPSKYKEQNLYHTFGITLAEYNSMLAKQNNVCAICKQPETVKHQSGKVRDLSVDHNHTTGKIRAPLCSSCNMGLGKFKDNFEYLVDAAKYIQKHEV